MTLKRPSRKHKSGGNKIIKRYTEVQKSIKTNILILGSKINPISDKFYGVSEMAFMGKIRSDENKTIFLFI